LAEGVKGMNDKKYFDNFHRIEEVIAQLDSREPIPEEAKKLYESGREMIKECEAILDGYSGTIKEMRFTL
jgi:exodeoxyribonuclease VII small subunit